jgi:methyl-accepting chemotaxis protein
MLGMLGLQQYSTNTMHDLMQTRLLTANIEAGMLMLRRNEKDFMSRLDLKYQEQFSTELGKTMSLTDQLAEKLRSQSLETSKALQVRSILQEYGAVFSEMVKIDHTIGLDHKSGLYGGLRDAIHKVEEEMKSLQDHQLQSDMLMLRRREKDFMLRWDMKYVEYFNNDFETFTRHLSVRDYPRATKDKITGLMKSYQDRFLAFAQGAQEKGLDSKSGIRGKMRETVHQTESLLETLQGNLEQAVAQKEAELTSLSWILAIAIITISILVVVLVAFGIIHPLNRLRGIMRDVAASKNLKMRSEARGHDEITQMSDAFNNMIDVFFRSVHEVLQSTVMLSTASEELSMITQTTRDGVQRQKSETQQVATAMNEMTATVQEVAHSASDAATASRTADEQSKKGRKLVNDTIDGIKSLAREVEKTSDEISHLKSETDNINTVLQVIGGIAEQTNLLALNAAIEAARAGAQGRGFAVVADEVRTLASRSQSSTKEISEIIDRLQKRAGTVVRAMEQSRKLANQCVDQADVAANSLDEIASAVSAINNMNLQIASAAEEQSSVAEEINRNIVNINDIATSSTEAANQTLQTSQSLAQLATELQTVVNQFDM